LILPLKEPMIMGFILAPGAAVSAVECGT
jgi:hypothetical protein